MRIDFQEACIEYLTNLRDTHSSMLATEELSLRPALDTFLKRAAEIFGRPVQFVGEPKKIRVGRPDFTVSVNDLPIGYIEAEAYGIDLNNLTGHAKEQNDRFRANLDNFLLTNHLEFHLYVGAELVDRVRLPAPLDKGKVKVSEVEAEALTVLFERFLSGQLPSIASPKDLALHLARRTKQLRSEVLSAIEAQSAELNGIYKSFQQVLLPGLTERQFADMYAQTITYGLFAARCTSLSGEHFNRQSAAGLVPKTNPFLRKLFQSIAAFDLDERVAWIADDTAQLLAQAPIGDILADFGTRTGKEDPVVHFYETFLAAYDPKLREVRGVYYTPEPVVSYIVRSIDHLLKTRFNKPMGLADEHTLILDPATGTGSFLFAIVKSVYETVIKTIGAGAWSDYVEKKLLPRLFGFELLIAPYAVAHLKLGLQLQETGYNFSSNRRLGIYLTNSLEEAVKKSDLLFGFDKFISDEANEAVEIKKEYPILVVLGNPPYSGHSANRSKYVEFIPPGHKYEVETKTGLKQRTAGKNGANVVHKTFIGRLIEDYKKVDGKPLGEKNSKWLQDDYVKFIRFAQWRIEQTGEGVIGYITNHGYLDNPTFRGMRQSLMQTFNEIYIYNLHGNSRKKEKTPEGGKDENVFDIQQGVAILLCLKEKNNTQLARISYADLWNLRKDKYTVLAETDVDKTEWTELHPSSPFYLFIPQDVNLLKEYEYGLKITEIFSICNVGIITKRDSLTIRWDKEEVWKTVTEFADLAPEEARTKYNLPKDVRDWKVEWAQQDLKNSDLSKDKIVPLLYRPFDIRFTYYTGKSRGFLGWPFEKIMHHMLDGNNLGIITTRQTRDKWNLFATKHICGHKSCDAYDVNSLFPLYLYPNEINGQTTTDTKRRPNLHPTFLKALAEKLNLSQTKPHDLPEGITPEDIFHYAYTVFHSPTYRERYADFLKIDFPRLPLTSDLDLFRDLAALGKQLVALHLLDMQAAPVLNMPVSPFPVVGSNVVEKVRYDEKNRRVYINKEQYFDTVPPEVWEFRVGGYQVCNKWLKDRKNRKLSIDDIQHYQRIVVALSGTMRLMEEIDKRIPEFPIQTEPG